MTLESIFPDFTVIRECGEIFPREWNALLAMDTTEALSEICNFIGLSVTSSARNIITSQRDIAILLPKRNRESGKPLYWRLGIRCSDRLAMFFSLPETAGMAPEYPAHYRALLERVGVCHLTQFGGHIVPPNRLDQASHEVNALLSVAEAAPIFTSITTLYDHETGDYDCWCGDDHQSYFFFDHESRTLTLYADGGFSMWFERRFMELHADYRSLRS